MENCQWFSRCRDHGIQRMSPSDTMSHPSPNPTKNHYARLGGFQSSFAWQTGWRPGDRIEIGKWDESIGIFPTY